ncbi:MAG: hypothetical protein DLM70_03175 [Chloroflexi bacterium]|nr:MAG: hypothetical protein DLM70_03175 [Chloroflexota bacterium]
MANAFPLGIRVGGAALPDGVMMLTPLACAIARETPAGLAIDTFPLPARKPNPLERIPFVRIIPKLVGQMSLVVRGWKPGGGQRPTTILAVAVLIGLISTGLNLSLTQLPTAWHAAGSSVLQLALFFGLIGSTRLVPRFGRIWRFHGGEHQAIAAYESGMDLTPENARTRTLYHPRCGTNLATLALIIMVPCMVVGSMLSGILGYVLTLAVPLPALCVAFEIIMLGQTRLRAVLWPGLAFQRLTVAMPGPTESAAGIAALCAALTEHVRVEAGREGQVATAGAHAAQ